MKHDPSPKHFVMNFTDRLAAAVERCGTGTLVGLDPRWEQLPQALRIGSERPARAAAYGRFCREVIDVVAGLVPAVKPQSAFFEQLGPAGMTVLAETIAYARAAGLLVILDAKRNDIGSTAEAYADGMLGAESAWGADALTISPYLGDDSLRPFVNVARSRQGGIFVLVKTSNPGGSQFQDLACPLKPLYEIVGKYVESLATESAGNCGYGDVGAVVGATYPQQLSQLREQMPHTWFLVPGYGSQGGSARDVAAAFDRRGLGALVNNSRGIIFAHASKQYADKYGEARWQEAVEAATRQMIDELAGEIRVRPAPAG